MKHSLSILCSLLMVTAAEAAPRLIVIVSLDQFPYEYLVRFQDHLSARGFRRLMEGGANFSSASYRHANNVTGPGHAAMLTGSYAWTNGIVSNSWYDRTAGRSVYCVADPGVLPVGGGNQGRSPVNLIGGTFGDQLRVHTGFRGKVLSVSNKDRAAILMGGRMPNGAYWMADSLFVSSTYYMASLPAWVDAFNRSGTAQAYWGKKWERVLPPEAYAAMDSDDVPYEWGGLGLGRTFPHPITGDDPQRRTTSYYEALETSPFGMEVLAKFALATVDNEGLGADDITDLLCVGFSSTDLVGHAFGPNSQEVMDMVVRTDRMLAGFLDSLDARVGLRNMIVVLTADHGVTPIPEYLQKNAPSLGARRVRSDQFREFCEGVMNRAYGQPPGGMHWILKLGHATVYLDQDALRKHQIDPDAAACLLSDSLMRWPDIALAVSIHDLHSLEGSAPLLEKFRRSWYPGRSGDLMFAFKPFIIMDDGTQGADHGAPYEYDAHVPLIFFGTGVRPGTYTVDVSPVDLAPTLSGLTGIAFPPGCEGRVLSEALQPF